MPQTFLPGDRLFFIAGPCLVEGEDLLRRVADTLAEAATRLDAQLVLKGSFTKANRTSGSSFTTIGEERALEILGRVGEELGLPTITDIHTPADAPLAARYVTLLQIPAFLSRQTELITAAAATGRGIMIKKGQFMAPEDMVHAVAKGRNAGAELVMACERGTTFGYHDLVVDMRSLVRMRSAGAPVVYDATHSLQQPSVGSTSGGYRELVRPLARAAVAVGIDGLFFETHPDPSRALSDAATQLPLDEASSFMEELLAIDAQIRALAPPTTNDI